MILTESITFQSRTQTIDSEGIIVDTWGTFKSGVPASVQPVRLNQTQLEAWGLTDLSANAKTIFVYRDTSISERMRIVAWDGIYEIRGINHWPIHTEIVAVPVQGT